MGRDMSAVQAASRDTAATARAPQELIQTPSPVLPTLAGQRARALPSHRGVAQSDRSETACLGWGGPGAQHRQHCPPGSAQRPAPTGAGGRPLAPVLVLTHLVPLVWLFMPLGNNSLSLAYSHISLFFFTIKQTFLTDFLPRLFHFLKFHSLLILA